MKKCTGCLNSKELSHYWKDSKTSDGLRRKCKKCLRAQNKAFIRKYRLTYKRTDKHYVSREEQARIRKTFNGQKGRMYSAIQNRLKYNKYYQKFTCSFTREEFYVFLKTTDYPSIYRQWRLSGFQLKYSPSVDRLNNNRGYELDNIRIVPSHLNWANKNRV